MERKRIQIIKPLEYLTEKDKWWDIYPGVSLVSLEQMINQWNLSENKVPLDVCHQFDIARALILYAYFSHKLINAAESQALSALELALKIRLEIGTKRSPGLKSLLLDATYAGFIKDKDFPNAANLDDPRERENYIRTYQESGHLDKDRKFEADEQVYCIVFAKKISSLRNAFLHGQERIFWPMTGMILSNVHLVVERIYHT